MGAGATFSAAGRDGVGVALSSAGVTATLGRGIVGSPDGAALVVGAAGAEGVRGLAGGMIADGCGVGGLGEVWLGGAGGVAGVAGVIGIVGASLTVGLRGAAGGLPG